MDRLHQMCGMPPDQHRPGAARQIWPVSSLLIFLAVAGLPVVTPGQDMALVTRSAPGRGRRAALLTALGIEAGLLVWTGASVLGLAALLAASALAFTAVKLAGAAYLVYPGLRDLARAGWPGHDRATIQPIASPGDDR